MARFFVGDIHGCLWKLNALIEKMQLVSGDRIIFGGDYVDRGPNSCGVIDRLIELSKVYDCVFLKGNHDDEFEKSIEEVDSGQGEWSPNYFGLWNHGLDKTIYSYRNAGKNPNCHLDWLKSLKYFHVEDEMLFVHAGIDRHRNVGDQSKEALIWDRDFVVLAYAYEHVGMPGFNPLSRQFAIRGGYKKVFLGHTPTMNLRKSEKLPIFMPNSGVVACDTGCGKYPDALLCAVNIDTNEIITNKKRKF